MIGEKIRSLFRPGNGFRPENGAGLNGVDVWTDLARRPARSPVRIPSPVDLNRRSNGLRQFFENLPNEERLGILDLGGASQANINFIALQGHKLHTEDLLIGLDRLHRSAGENNGREGLVRRFIDENLNFPSEQFDGILVWDSLEFLDEDLLAAAVFRLQAILKPGGTLLTFFHTHSRGESVNVYRYQIHDHQTLQLRPRFSRTLPRTFNNRNLERLFGNFRSVKFFLAKDSLREVIVTR